MSSTASSPPPSRSTPMRRCTSPIVLSQNTLVPAERPVIRVPDVRREPPGERDILAPVDLSPARDAAAHLVAARLLGRVPVQILRTSGRGPTGQMSRRSTLIGVGSPSIEVLRRKRPSGVGGDPHLPGGGRSHGAQLEHGERHAAVPRPRLPEQHRRALRDPHGQRCRAQQRRGRQQPGRGPRYVQRPLGRAVRQVPSGRSGRAPPDIAARRGPPATRCTARRASVRRATSTRFGAGP